MGVEQRTLPPKQPPVGEGTPIAAVLATEDKGVDRAPLSPAQLGELTEHLPRALAPVVAERGEVRIALFEA